MSKTKEMFLLLILSCLIVYTIAFAFAIIIKKHTKIKVIFYLPLGFLTILGISFLLSFPFVLFKLPAIIYQIILILIIIVAIIYSIYLIRQDFSLIKYDKVTLFFTLLIAVLTIYACYQTTKYTIAESAFDSVFYATMAINNVNPSTLGWINYDWNMPAEMYSMLYDFTSYFYVQGLILKIITWIYPVINQVMYAPLYMWQATITLISFSAMTIVNVYNNLTEKKRNYSLLIVLIGIIYFFYGSQYFNTAFAFYGNSYRPLVLGNIFLIIYQLFKKNQFTIRYQILLGVLISALMAVSSSGFFMSAFCLYGLFYALLYSKRNLDPFKIIIPIALPTILYLFTFVLGSWTFLLTPLLLGCFYFISKTTFSPEKINLYLRRFILFVVPILIILAVFLLQSKIHYGFDYFFFNGSFYDMVWDYFVYPDFLTTCINLLLVGLILFLIFNPIKKENSINQIIRIIALTFLNPLVIPFTILFLTDFVFYRAFDLFFNPFIIGLALYQLSHYLKNSKLQQSVLILISIPFIIYGYLNYNSYYHYFFIQPDNYNFLLKQTNEQYEVLTELNNLIKEHGIEDPNVIPQIVQTIGYVPNIHMPFSSRNLRERSARGLTVPQIDILNIMLLRMYPDQYWVNDYAPNYEQTCPLIFEHYSDFVIIYKDSYFYNSETDEYIFLYSLVYECSEVVYETDHYLIFFFKK